MKIVKAKPSDATKISGMRIQTIKKVLSKYYKKEAIQEMLGKNSPKKIKQKIEERNMFCLWDKEGLLGTIDIKENTIGGLYIKHSLIGKGLGKELLTFIENRAKKQGLKKVTCYPTKNALPFYKKLGYKVKSKSYWQTDKFKILIPLMEKNLA